MITEYKNEIITGEPVSIEIKKIIVQKNNIKDYKKIKCYMNFFYKGQLVQDEIFELNLTADKFNTLTETLSRSTKINFDTKKNYSASLYKKTRQNICKKYFRAIFDFQNSKIVCSCSLI